MTILLSALNKSDKRFLSLKISSIHALLKELWKIMRRYCFAIGKFDFDRAFHIEVDCNDKKPKQW